jgi:hypothetical protein
MAEVIQLPGSAADDRRLARRQISVEEIMMWAVDRLVAEHGLFVVCSMLLRERERIATDWLDRVHEDTDDGVI